ncbi:energy-coupling factor transport system ATP-binding protein [Weissella uvarum]|uniref:ABC transporter ATP-binding protein n=1 Tax=Weissella uvarum TaxID=1479233 RepID=UPI00195FA9C2|nr:ABC transporter ATP-binding protein [Weissella uvarum]MBM7617160.1 energy-coupling factor transport system ATP-binding protein [Weissella uvarum]MCM0595456.1 ABC transporter ATP-binding protein [Weissella uvarum]
MTTLSVNHFSFQYDETHPAQLHDVTWQPQPGSFNLLVGPSGSGKSTLLHAMAGLLPHYGGQILQGNIALDGVPIDTVAPFERSKRVGLLFQNPNRQFAMQTPTEELRFALENLQLPKDVIEARIPESLTAVGISHLAHHKITTLSGGEKQKVALATVLALGSDFILLDEPFANVDPVARESLLALLKTLQQDLHKTIIVTDHDLSGYTSLVDNIYQLNPETKSLQVASQDIFAQFIEVAPAWFKPQVAVANSPLALEQVGLTVADRTLLTDATFQFPKGQLGLLSGANGSGKSTLFAAISHQTNYTGKINWQDQDSQKIKLKKWSKTVGLVFQDALDQFVKFTVQDELALSQKYSLLPNYWTNERITTALTQLNLTDFTTANLYQLSGGQQKKVQILSMLMMGQAFLLFDEPLAGLDYASMQQVLSLIQQTLRDNHLSGVLISHQRTGLDSFIDYEIRIAHQTLITEVPHAN